jgi:hypothetical protein
MSKALLGLLGAVACALAPTAAGAVKHVVNAGGVLIGADDVLVNGTSYKVRFATGTCDEVFGTCAAASFDFTDDAFATAAAQALADQVFTGVYDTNPTSLGCSSNACYTFVPYAVEARPNGEFLASEFRT